VPEPLRRRVHEAVQLIDSGVGSLGLQPYGVATSDGYRPPPDLAPPSVPRPGMEHNITVMMATGLADRARAVFILEAMGNNLQAAVEVLLAVQRQPARQ
jgi:hypothetical protein